MTKPGVVETVARYEDGSVSVTSMEASTDEPAGGIGARSVSGCTTAGTGTVNRTLTNCHVSATTGIVTMAFYANYKYTYGSLSDPWVKAG